MSLNGWLKLVATYHSWQHLQSNLHRDFVLNPSNYSAVDQLVAEMLPGFDPDPPEQPAETLELCGLCFYLFSATFCHFIWFVFNKNKEPSVFDNSIFLVLFLPDRDRRLAMMVSSSRRLMKLKWTMPFGPCRDEGPRSTVPPSVAVGAPSPPAQEAHLQAFCFPPRAWPHPPPTSRCRGVQRCLCWMPSHRPAMHLTPSGSPPVLTVCLRPLTSTPSLRSLAHRLTISLKMGRITHCTRTRPFSVLSAASVLSRSRLHLPMPHFLLWRKWWGQSQEAEGKQSCSAVFHFQGKTESAGIDQVPGTARAKDASTRRTVQTGIKAQLR